MILNSSELSNYTILVTGAGGFIGTRLTECLLNKGAKVIGVDVSWPHGAQRFVKHDSFTMITGGFAEREEEIRGLLAKKRGTTAFIHLAGLSNASACEEDPFRAFDANMMLTVRVLELCKEQKVDKFIYPSTGYVYGDQLRRAAVETDATNPGSLYAVTKLTAETLIQGYSHLSNMACVIARLSNVYGSSSSENTIAGLIMTQVRSGSAIRVRSFAPVRDFIYMDDVTEGISRLVAADIPGCAVINLSSGKGTSVCELAETICAAADYPRERIEKKAEPDAPFSAMVLDNSRLKQLTGWKPQYSLKKGMASIMKGTNGHAEQ